MKYFLLVTICLAVRLGMALLSLLEISSQVEFLVVGYYLLYGFIMLYKFATYEDGMALSYFTKDTVYWNQFRAFHGVAALVFAFTYFFVGERYLVFIPLVDWLVAFNVIMRHNM